MSNDEPRKSAVRLSHRHRPFRDRPSSKMRRNSATIHEELVRRDGSAAEIESLNRRALLRSIGAASLGIGAMSSGGSALGQDELPQLSQENPRATALQYTSDATAPDQLLPGRGEGEFCRNCRLFQGEVGQSVGWAGCEIFPEFRVSAQGWCNTWTERPD